ncbi:hypothetical protein FB451DRAFT_1477727 [Mycena latifolia]|nr:hypothetical protein FB451DRAFT_1477727 [Mycena latifolia]
MQSLPPACFPVQELWDHVISFLIDSSADLSACSTTCRSLTPAAQSRAHIFYDVVLLPSAAELYFDGVQPHQEDSGAVARCDRLCAVLLRSPHLTPYIRRITLSCTIELLTPVVAIQLPNLREVYLSLYHGTPPSLQDEDPLARLAQKLVGLPSVERASIWSMAQRVAFFATALGGGRSQLRSISLVCPTLVDSSTAIQPLPQRGSPLTELHLVGPAQLCDSRSTIRRVRLDQITVADLDLNVFDKLIDLVTYTDDPEDGMPNLEMALARLNDQNNIEKITLKISALATDTAPSVFHSLDSALAARRMTFLQQFVACFIGVAVNRPADEEGILRSYFPLLDDHGLLVVSMELLNTPVSYNIPRLINDFRFRLCAVREVTLAHPIARNAAFAKPNAFFPRTNCVLDLGANKTPFPVQTYPSGNFKSCPIRATVVNVELN